MTVVDKTQSSFSVQVGPETLRLTNLGELQKECLLTLKRALRVGDRLGGHIVQGHVDGLGRSRKAQRQGEWEMIWFSCPAECAADDPQRLDQPSMASA